MASSVQDLLSKRNDPGYLNWLAVGEALIILSDGLRKYAGTKMKELQSLLISKLVGVTCSCLCVPGKKPNLHEKPKTCTWATELGNLHRNGRKYLIPWYQSDSSKWHDPADGYWEIAKIFMSDLRSKWSNVKDPATTDTTGILNLLIFCTHIKVQQHLLESVRDSRNDWAHAPDHRLSEPDKQSAFKNMVNLINDVELMSCKEVQDCSATIKEVRDSKVAILPEKHLRVLEELRYLKEFELMNTVEENQRHVDKELKILKEMTKTLEQMISAQRDHEPASCVRDYLSGMTFYAKAILASLLLMLFLVFSKKNFRILTCFFLVAFFVSQVGDKSVLLSDSGCSRCIEKSPISHFQEFNFSSHLSYKRENFFGRRWFFKELEDIFESDRAPSGVLITGEPGSGKSALLSQLICSPFSSLLIYSNIIGYHLCDYSEKGKSDGARFVRNLVAQIAESIPEYSSHVTNNEQIRRELDERCKSDPTGCFFSTIVGPLRDLRKPDGFRYIVLDALDECFEKDGKTSTILDILNSKISQFPTWLKLIMSSRNWTAVTTKIPRTLSRIPLDPTDERNVEDIRSYITRFLSQNLFFTDRLLEAMSSKSTAMQIQHWVNELTDRGEGNFLFVKTTLWNSVKFDSRINLHSFPTSLYDTYDIFFKRHFNEDDFGRFKMLFEVLLAAGSPRQLHEIDEILKLQNQTQEISKLVQQVSFFLRFGLDGTVSIFHQSFAEWLVNQANSPGGFIIRKNKGHQYIVDFVLDRIRRRNAELTFEELSELTAHVVSGELTQSYKQALDVLNVSEIRDPHSGRCILHDLAKTSNGFPVLEVLLCQFVSCDIPDMEEKTPAFYAASENIVDNLKLFIDSGADVNYIFKNLSSLDSISAVVQNWGMEDYSMIHVAAYKGHTKIVELLIQSNASYTQSNQNGPTAFHLAAGNGHLEIVKLLYNNDAKADLISLHHAAARNHSAVVEFLLKTARVRDACLPCRSVNISQFSPNTTFQDFHSFFCETALHAAVSRRYIGIVKLLLRFGRASLECKHYSGKTPLMDAVRRNDTEMVELLLNEGADVEATCGSGTSADSNEQMCVFSLSYKIRYMYTVYCEKDVCACGNKAIHLCARHGLWEIAQKLIDKWNCNLLDKNCKGQTVWEISKFFHHKDFIFRLNRMLLTKLHDETSLEQQPNKLPTAKPKYQRRYRAFKKLLQKFFMKTKPYQSSYQCDSTFDGFSPLHIAALLGVKMLRHVYPKALKIVPNLPLNCTNKHWIVPRYLAYFYESDQADKNPRRLKVKQKTKHDNDLAFVQYPDREAEFHIIYNYLYNSPAEGANVLYYKSLPTLFEYGLTDCPGFYDLLPTRKTLNVKDYCYKYSFRPADDDANNRNSAKSLAQPLDIYQRGQPCFCVCDYELRLMQEKFARECFCPHVMRELQSWFTSSPRKNRKVSPFIAERMGWKDASADGDVQDRWPFYFLYKKLINDYKSYKYLEILDEGFKINHKRHDDDDDDEGEE